MLPLVTLGNILKIHSSADDWFKTEPRWRLDGKLLTNMCEHVLPFVKLDKLALHLAERVKTIIGDAEPGSYPASTARGAASRRRRERAYLQPGARAPAAQSFFPLLRPCSPPNLPICERCAFRCMLASSTPLCNKSTFHH